MVCKPVFQMSNLIRKSHQWNDFLSKLMSYFLSLFYFWKSNVFYHDILCPPIIFCHFILFFSTLTFIYPSSHTILHILLFSFNLDSMNQKKIMQCLTFWVWLISPTIQSPIVPTLPTNDIIHSSCWIKSTVRVCAHPLPIF